MDVTNEKTDRMPISRVILMSCGRYNPPTYMHLRMFERAKDHLHTLRAYEVVGGVVSPVNDHCKQDDLANSSTRCHLLKLALKTSNWIRLSRWETRQKSFRSIKETLRYHQNILNNVISNSLDNNVNNEDTEWIPDDMKNNSNPMPVQIKLLCGADLLESFLAPGQWSENDIAEIVGQYGLVVIGKEGSSPNKFIYDSDILSRYLHNIHTVTEWIPNEVNATRIRRALRRGESVKYLLQNDIAESIYESAVYSAKRPVLDSTIMSSEKSGITTTTTTTTTTTGNRVILIACGSYNPPTHMHLRMFERARDHLHKLGNHVVIGGVISPTHDAYGKKDLASGKHRVEMLRLALNDSDWIKLSNWEIRQTGWTRTLTSLRHHQSLLDTIGKKNFNDDATNSNTFTINDNEDHEWLPGSLIDVNNEDDDDDYVGNSMAPVRLKLLCGGDLLESFATPGLWLDEDITEIVSQYGLIVITREGSHPYKFIYDSDVLSKHLHNIQIVTEWIPNEVSSSRIRRALKRGESVKYLLQDSVIDYVYENGIYGADRPTAIKLNLSSIHSSTDYLDDTADDADEPAKYERPDSNAYLTTPSPSDITMLEASPCCVVTDTSTTTTTTTTIDELNDNDDDDDDTDDCAPLSDSVLQKNIQNSAVTTVVESSPSNNVEETELAREKFFRSLVNESLNFDSVDSLSSQHHHHQPELIFSSRIEDEDALEPPSSERARNELLAFEEVTTTTTTESELVTICGDNTNSETDDKEYENGVLSVTYEESSEDLNESSVKNNNNYRGADEESSDNKAEADEGSSVREEDEDDPNESLSYDGGIEFTGNQQRELIDGKYRKSLVNSIKSNGKKLEDDDSVKLREDEDDKEKYDVVEKKSEEEEDELVRFEEDLSYIKKLRLVINNEKTTDGKVDNKSNQVLLQGSLDSINLRERGDAQQIVEPAGMNESSMAKKSKSYESIKRIVVPLSFVNRPSTNYHRQVAKMKSDSASQLVLGSAIDNDEFCSVCCYATETANDQLQHKQSSAFYPVRSDYSSPEQDDSEPECDICGSRNLQEDKLEITELSSSETAPAEICEICGEPATEPATINNEADEDNDDPRSRRARPFGLPKAKSTIEISRGYYNNRSTTGAGATSSSSCAEDDRFEIDNCGLRDCKLRASLDVCNKPEPLYVNVMPRYHQPTVRQPYSESSSYYYYCDRAPQQQQQQQYLVPVDHVSSMSRSLSVGGSKRPSRRGGSSYAKRNAGERGQEKRRFSSADNLQNRASFKCGGNFVGGSSGNGNTVVGNEKFSKTRDNKFMTSADSIRTPRVSRSRSLRRSADNVGRFDSSGDNLDSLEETADTDEALVEVADGKEMVRCSGRIKTKDERIQMILTKHGIKVISQKETVL